MSIYERVSIHPSDALPPAHQMLEHLVDTFELRTADTFVLPSETDLEESVKNFANSHSLALENTCIDSVIKSFQLSLDGQGFYPHSTIAEEGTLMIRRDEPVRYQQIRAVAEAYYSDKHLVLPYTDNPLDSSQESADLFHTLGNLVPDEPISRNNLSFVLQMLRIYPDHAQQSWKTGVRGNIIRTQKIPFKEKWAEIREHVANLILDRVKSHPIIIAGHDFTISHQGVHSIHNEYVVLPDEKSQSALTDNFERQIGINYHDVLKILNEEGFVEGHHSGRRSMGKHIYLYRSLEVQKNTPQTQS